MVDKNIFNRYLYKMYNRALDNPIFMKNKSLNWENVCAQCVRNTNVHKLNKRFRSEPSDAIVHILGDRVIVKHTAIP